MCPGSRARGGVLPASSVLRPSCASSSRLPLRLLCEGSPREGDREREPAEERPALGGHAQRHRPRAAVAQVGLDGGLHGWPRAEGRGPACCPGLRRGEQAYSS